MTQLVLAHAMPSSNSFVAANRAGIAVTTGANVILQDEILADHSGSVPDELIHVERRWRGAFVPRVGSLAISLLKSVLMYKSLRVRGNNAAQLHMWV